MATIASTSKSVAGQFAPAAVAIGAADTFTYLPNVNQELIMFNTSGSSVNVTISGAANVPVAVPGAGQLTASTTSLVIAVAAGTFEVLRLDTVAAFLQGAITVSAATVAVVNAIILK